MAKKKANKKAAKKSVKKRAKITGTKKAKLGSNRSKTGKGPKSKSADPLGQMSSNPLWSLDAKIRRIKRRNPIMPCSGICRGEEGYLVAHTQFTEVAQRYNDECIREKLEINLINLVDTDSVFDTEIRGLDGKTSIVKKACVRCVGTFTVTCTETGQSKKFWGMGEGSNGVWRALTAQTKMFKQALLMLFFTSWPQPSDTKDIVRGELAKVPEDQLLGALTGILPNSKLGKVIADAATKAIKDYFGKKQKKG